MRKALAALVSGALVVAAGAAGADEGARPMPAEVPTVERSWIAAQLDRVHLHKKSGLAYTTRVARADRDLEVSLHGPAMGGVKRLGVALEVRF